MSNATCPRCNGEKRLPQHSHTLNGTCFLCQGTGVVDMATARRSAAAAKGRATRERNSQAKRAAALEVKEDAAFDRHGDTWRLAVALCQFPTDDAAAGHRVSTLMCDLRDVAWIDGSAVYRELCTLAEGAYGLAGWGLEDIEAAAADHKRARLSS